MSKGIELPRLRWSRAKHRPRNDCSLCRVPVDFDEVPLIMWKPNGDCVTFCEDCAATCLGPRQ